MVDITEVSAIFASAGVIVGVALTVLEIRNLVRQRQTDLIMSYIHVSVVKDFRKYSKKWY